LGSDWWTKTFPEGRQTLEIEDASGQKVAIAYGSIGQGQPLLLLHGIGSWSYNWRSCLAPLAERFQVICVDAKGYGFSQASPLPDRIGHQVIELKRIIQALSPTPVCIAGESLGGLTALALAQAEPGLVQQLVVINVPIFPRRLPSWGMRSLAYLPLPLIQIVDRSQLIRPFAPLIRQITRRMRREVVVDPAEITPEEIHWLTYPYLHFPGQLTQFATDLKLAAQEIDRLHRQQPNWITQIQQQLPQVTCPTLVLWADQDRWFPPEDGRLLKDRLPHAQFQLLSHCGHVASSHRPEAVSTAILAFLTAQSLV
jgi:pimeloyl-ACP methyl ester carboxylesterase